MKVQILLSRPSFAHESRQALDSRPTGEDHVHGSG